MNMIERVARAISGVQLFIRFNDWASDRVEGSPIEICRYGRDGEPEIVVIKRFSAAKKEDDALYEVIAEQRSIAAISAMIEPTEAMNQAVDTAENDMGVCRSAYEQIDWKTAWKVAIDASLKETDNAHDR